MRRKHLSSQSFSTRRSLLVAGGLALLALIARFAGFSVPRQPQLIEFGQRIPASGVIVLTDCILFDRQEKTWAVARRCTHLGCKVNFHEVGQYLECPCHHSRFTLEGLVIKGPAAKPLPVYAVSKQEAPPYYIVTIPG